MMPSLVNMEANVKKLLSIFDRSYYKQCTDNTPPLHGLFDMYTMIVYLRKILQYLNSFIIVVIK